MMIETSGTVVLIEPEFTHKYVFGNLVEASLSELVTNWWQEYYPLFSAPVSRCLSG
jgi:hypothetical protein